MSAKVFEAQNHLLVSFLSKNQKKTRKSKSFPPFLAGHFEATQKKSWSETKKNPADFPTNPATLSQRPVFLGRSFLRSFTRSMATCSWKNKVLDDFFIFET